MKNKQQYSRSNLTNYSCVSCTFHSHFRARSNTVDHDWIENNIYNSTNHLSDCRIKRTTCCL